MPYDGLFVPYAEPWTNLGPINTGLSQYNVTYEMVDSHYESVQQAGFHSLSYFDVGNFGTRVSSPCLQTVSHPHPRRALCFTFRLLRRMCAHFLVVFVIASVYLACSQISLDPAPPLPPANSSTAGCGLRPGGLQAPCWAPEETASSSFLATQLSASVLDNGWSAGNGFVTLPLKDWVGTTDMDPGEQVRSC